jgi:hypothetical protein
MYSIYKMTLKDLDKLVSNSQQENTRKELFERLQGKPFWIWDKQQHNVEEKTGWMTVCCQYHYSNK